MVESAEKWSGIVGACSSCVEGIFLSSEMLTSRLVFGRWPGSGSVVELKFKGCDLDGEPKARSLVSSRSTVCDLGVFLTLNTSSALSPSLALACCCCRGFPSRSLPSRANGCLPALAARTSGLTSMVRTFAIADLGTHTLCRGRCHSLLIVSEPYFVICG